MANEEPFFLTLGGPARRALGNEGITTLTQLSKKSKPEILKLHGMGPSTIPKLEAALKKKGLSFRIDKPVATRKVSAPAKSGASKKK